MYKDKDKQREANRQAKVKERGKKAKMTIHSADKTFEKAFDKAQGMTKGMTSEGMTQTSPVIPKHSYIGAVPEVPGLTVLKPKRGKDIKCFADLPDDVQQTIDIMSRDDAGKIDPEDKDKRTAIAIKYQHLFPDRYHLTGVAHA